MAGYCWDWVSRKTKSNPVPRDYDIKLDGGDFKAKWSLAEDGFLWIVKPDSVREVGCIHTCQGLELGYVGVIIGPDLVVRDGVVITDGAKRSSGDSSIKGYKKMLKADRSVARAKADLVIKNTYRTLMTRGTKGCYVHSTDPEPNLYLQTQGACALLPEFEEPEIPDTGGQYTVKIYRSEKTTTEDSWSHLSIHLRPDSMDFNFKTLTLNPDTVNDLRVIGEYEASIG